jgi:hypothetical protein
MFWSWFIRGLGFGALLLDVLDRVFDKLDLE